MEPLSESFSTNYTQGGEEKYNFMQPIKGEIQLDNLKIPSISLSKKIGAFNKNDFTITFWLQTTAKHRLFDVLGNRTDGSHGNFFCIRMTGKHESCPEGMISAEVDQDYNGTNYISVQSAKTGLNDGKWHHVAVVRKSGSLKIYIDGESSGEGKAKDVANIQQGSDFRIGRSYGDFADVNLKFNDLRIYENTALSGDEISNLLLYRED